ncbi:CheY-like chemotaxis protein [Sphingobium sp. B2D3A]|uniref:response regulator n=1 Tax=unclassified Sphingobium TaxID=2611147 RepID=UPI0022248A4F|nr:MULTISPECIES: response regulator [unclassified Sphingobium]MCW2339148.1 CheY-like chemotaxis protein [Sphingobium sp. B2D3A]MCW2370765.1 CheY-like chemotaxis protein [Sphingobium sp. B11D3D]MCW2386908.1 CheY-like chemotaxis protein [Sphingobium sp. B2D3D]
MPQVASVEKSTQILYADDEDDLRVVVTRLLARVPDFEVQDVNSGAALLARLADPACKPDVILLDVMMPGLDGLETARRVRRTDQQTPIIFFTANAELTEQWRASDGPILGTLKKPFDPDMLALDILRMLGRQLSSDPAAPFPD